jgi:hypothetical protein
MMIVHCGVDKTLMALPAAVAFCYNAAHSSGFSSSARMRLGRI